MGHGSVNTALGQFEHCLILDLVVGFSIFVVHGVGGFLWWWGWVIDGGGG